MWLNRILEARVCGQWVKLVVNVFLSDCALEPSLRLQSNNLDSSGFVQTQDLEDYSEQTFSAMLYLTLEAMGEGCHGSRKELPWQL